MTLQRYLRLWRELNAVTIDDIANDLNIKPYYVRLFDRTQNSEQIWEWYNSHGFSLEGYNNVKEKYQRKKEKVREKKESTS